MPYDDELHSEFTDAEACDLLDPPRCAHCGSSSGIENMGHRSTVRMEHWDYYQKDTFGCESHVYHCRSCDDITAIRVVHSYSNQHSSVLYPHKYSLDTPGPSSIRYAAQHVERTLTAAPRDCALAVRRLLEAICLDQGMAGDNLEARLECLADNGILPRRTITLCHLLRKVGNMSAHYGESGDRITSGDVRLLYASVRLLLESLYGIDLVIDRLQRRVDSRMQPPQTNQNGPQ